MTLPKGINYAGYIGHSALRTYVMGERAFEEQASEDDLKSMQNLVKEAINAGAIGFSTSRTFNHITADERPVASRLADWDEVRAIVNAVGETGKGIFEIAGEAPGRDPEKIREYHVRLRDLAVESGVTQTWGMFSTRIARDLWRPYFDLLDETAAAGGRMFAQVHSRASEFHPLVREQHALRQVGDVVRHPRAAARRTEGEARQTRRSRPSSLRSRIASIRGRA